MHPNHHLVHRLGELAQAQGRFINDIHDEGVAMKPPCHRQIFAVIELPNPIMKLEEVSLLSVILVGGR